MVGPPHPTFFTRRTPALHAICGIIETSEARGQRSEARSNIDFRTHAIMWPIMHKKLTTIVLIAMTLLFVGGGGGVAFADDNHGKKNKAAIIIEDSFSDSVGTLLGVHTPTVDDIGTGWQTTFGQNFAIDVTGEAIADPSGLNTPYFSIIDGRLESIDLTVEFVRSGQSSEVGLVFRWIDPLNHFRAEFDGQQGRIIKVVGGVETELGSKKAKWKAGKQKTIRVVDNAGTIQLWLNNKKISTVSDGDLAGETRVGLYYQNNSSTSVLDFTVKSSAPLATPLTVTLGPIVVQDSFDTGAGPMNLRPADNVPGQPEWVEIKGTWEVTTGGDARLVSLSGGGDQTVVIPTGIDDADISADITWNGGITGLAWGVDASNNRSIAFWDGHYIVAGRIEPSTGAFREYGRAPYDWATGTTRNLRVRINGSNARIYIDDPSVTGDENRVLILARGTSMGSAKRAGLFTKGTTNLFHNFTVRQSVPLDQPDPNLTVSSPQVLDPPPVPDGAWMYDSFTYYNSDVIQNRFPDLDPSGSGWQIESGRWQFTNFEVTQTAEVAGDQIAFIDTGRDEYMIESTQQWDGGRTGLTFGGQAPDNRNGFLFFKQSDNTVVLGKKIGGVFFTLDVKKTSWKIGRSEELRVEIKQDKLRAFVGNRQVFKLTDTDLVGATWTGFFRNAYHNERFDNFLLRLPAGVPEPTPVPPPTPVLVDTFTDADTTLLAVHAPDVAPVGSTWFKSTARGDWEISGNTAIETGVFDYGIQDRRILIDAQISDSEVSAVVTRYGPQWTTFFARNMFPRSGIITRANFDGTQYLMWFFDGASSVVALSNSGELGRVSIAWNVGESHLLSVVANGSSITFLIDAVPVMTRTYSPGAGNTYYGLFSADIEAGKANAFDDFQVVPLQ